MGGAFIGVADDWTAIYWNPAGLSQLDKTGLGLSVEILDARAHDSAGLINPVLPFGAENIQRGDSFAQLGGEPNHFNGLDSRFVVPLPAAGFYTHVHGITLAAGSYAPLGFSFRVDDNSQPGYQASFKSQGYMVNHNFSLSKEVLPHVRLGTGVNLVQARLVRTSNKKTPFSEYSTSSKGDGLGVQGVFGLLVDVLPQLQVGGVYRTGQDMSLKGHVSVSNSVPAISESTDATTHLRNPTTYGIGVCWKPIEHWRASADWQRTSWQGYRIDNTVDQPGLILQDQQINPGWSLSSRYRFGLEWQGAHGWSVRGGYFRDPQAVSFASQSLTNLIDVDLHYYTAGLSYSTARWRVSGGEQYAVGHENLPGRTLRREAFSETIQLDYFL